jgi:hypothetical protein
MPSVVYVPGSTEKVYQLTGEFDRHRQEPTLNRTESRFGLAGTDLGASFEHEGRLFFLFGDTHAVRPHPVYRPTDGDSIASTSDPDPEAGIRLDFVLAADGDYLSPRIPGVSLGAYEVPAGGFSLNGSMYVFFTTDHSATRKMGRSVLSSSEDNGKSFRYLHDVSVHKFINVAPQVVESGSVAGLPVTTGRSVLLWGSGEYRRSHPYLACLPSTSLAAASLGMFYYSGLTRSGRPQWSHSEADARPLFLQPCIGELSVAWNTFLEKWLMLYNCDSPRGINFRVSDDPWGPWSPPAVLFDPWKDNGYCHFMHANWDDRQCDSVHDPGRERVWGGEYGPYLIAPYTRVHGTSSTIYFVMSTWNPYNTVLMRSSLEIVP